jgi:hypothetical protein
MSYKRIQYILIKIILWFALLLLITPIYSQSDSVLNDGLQRDTVISESKYRSFNETSNPKDTIIASEVTDTSKTPHKIPRVAAISSAILPGLGQAYNGKYYKIPIIYGAGTIMYYYLDRYNYNYQRLKKARKELTETGVISDPELENFDKASLDAHMNNFRRNRDYQIIFLGLLYVANIVDAMVDAHMYEFDVSEDLTMKIGPSFTPLPTESYTASAGLRLSLRF